MEPGEFLKHLDELRFRVIRIFAGIMLTSMVLLLFRIQYLTVGPVTFPFLYPDPYSNVGAQFIKLLEYHLLPSGTELLILRPSDGLMADFYSCLFLGFSLSMPYSVHHAWAFVKPALKPGEIHAARQVVIPATVLFITGAVFGLWIVLPELFAIFNMFDIGLGVVSSVSVTSFLNFVLIYTLIFGVSFEVPVFMVALTGAGVIPAKFWRDHWRHAVIGAFVFGMIFSPGVTGFTMTVMAIPMIALYLGGMWVSVRVEAKRTMETGPAN
ncbi:MAG: Sec-independent protein translocase TatC [Candidatus Thermoplasmatota archaeon]|nr:Sec-independent protein translocase TatC [Candidatus Thermoplasmatota archaeon]MCL5786186.1 Sec-independent protein translocase TatC [Candidatus Thermoplasmatota archaeon]